MYSERLAQCEQNIEKILERMAKLEAKRQTKREKDIALYQACQGQVITPIQQFVAECCVLGNYSVTVDILYEAHRQWFMQHNAALYNKVWFSRSLLLSFPVVTYRPLINGIQTTCYKGIKLNVQETV
jgi:hypothetical protein